MERAVAVKKLGKLLGKSLGYRVDPSAPTQEERDEAKQELAALTAARKAAEDAKRARFEAILAADDEYQRLFAAAKAARDAEQKVASKLHHFRFTVGTTNSMFFHVKAQGDSWEEVINKLSNGTE